VGNAHDVNLGLASVSLSGEPGGVVGVQVFGGAGLLADKAISFNP
jgi:hypothetical protein